MTHALHYNCIRALVNYFKYRVKISSFCKKNYAVCTGTTINHLSIVRSLSFIYTIIFVVNPVVKAQRYSGYQTGCQTSCQTGLTTGCIVYTNIQPVVKPV